MKMTKKVVFNDKTRDQMVVIPVLDSKDSVSDTKSIISNERDDENKSEKSNDSSIDRQLGCFTNKVMNIGDENDVLVSNNNYGTINCSVQSVIKSKSHIDISRDVIDIDDLNHKYGKRNQQTTDSVLTRVRRSATNCCQCSPMALFLSLFPIFNWIRSYSVKEYLINDVIAGFTILILHIPQGMAYGMLSGLQAINGLYVSFFPVLVYSLMGTSRHLSIGTFAIISIMSSNAAEKLNAGAIGAVDNLIGSTKNSTHFMLRNTTDSTVDYTTLEVLTSLCILTGIFQLLMGFMQLGVVSVILSDTLVSAYSTGCAIHVATSQMASLFDIKLPKNEVHFDWMPFQLINQWISLCKRLGNTNVVTLGLSVFGITLLVVVKELVEPKLKKRFKLNVPIPIDILLVIGFTLFSWLMKLNPKHNVDIMGDIPKGLPEPQLPRLDLLPSIIIDSLVIAIVAFAVSLSLAKIFAKKHKYKIDANQELIALGAANVFSSLFACYPSSASLSRSSVQERTGGKTQMAGIVSSVFMLVFLLFLGPLLHDLPKTTLSCIILVALKSMFLQFSDLLTSWRISKLEAFQWLVTFIAVILLGVDIGLIVGILFSLIVVLLRFTMPKSTINGQLAYSEIYVDSNEFLEAKQPKGMKIFQFHCPLFFMNAQNFKTNLYMKTLDITNNEIERLREEKPTIRTIILDFSSVFFIDSTGVETIIEVIDELDEFNIKVILCQCSQSVIQVLERMKFFTKVVSPNICATVHDAVVLNDTTLV